MAPDVRRFPHAFTAAAVEVAHIRESSFLARTVAALVIPLSAPSDLDVRAQASPEVVVQRREILRPAVAVFVDRECRRPSYTTIPRPVSLPSCSGPPGYPRCGTRFYDDRGAAEGGTA
jgi:hypothetical protein